MKARTVPPRWVVATLAGALMVAACGHASRTTNPPGTDASPTVARSAAPAAFDSIRFHPASEFPGPDDLPAPGGHAPLVPESKIISGGPPPDGITPIDHPKFTVPSRATFLAPNEPVLSVTHGTQTKAYPLQIL